ncbi:MAG TPA: HD domain-containing protein [Thermoanaerobaculia bacterium]|nr:HD domain-containing protein [Thermoanaerobaculia bacterium]
MLSIRDPIHGFIRADPLEAALIASRPVQRLRFIHQLGLTFLVFPGAEHSRFSHALGAMHLAGRVYDALRGRGDGALSLLPAGAAARERRLVRVAALLHDLGHAPFSHSTEELFEGGIDHEEMTRRLIAAPEIAGIFARHGGGLTTADVVRLLKGGGSPGERLLAQIVSGELDVDKMDYLLRDSLFCGVRYGSYDLDRLLDTLLAIEDPASGEQGIGLEEGGVHAVEALVMARYYMFTQVYFNVTGKALELHLNAWLIEEGTRWAAEPESFLAQDDVSIWTAMRRSPSLHARAVTERLHFPLAFETREHLRPDDKERFEALIPELARRFGEGNLLISNSAKDPHRLRSSRVLVRRYDGALEPMTDASQFIRHLARIDRYRVYTPQALRSEVGAALRELWTAPATESSPSFKALDI